MPVSALKVCVVGWWWLVNSEFSDRLWLIFSLALAKPNNFQPTLTLIGAVHGIYLTKLNQWSFMGASVDIY